MLTLSLCDAFSLLTPPTHTHTPHPSVDAAAATLVLPQDSSDMPSAAFKRAKGRRAVKVKEGESSNSKLENSHAAFTTLLPGLRCVDSFGLIQSATM